MSKIEKISLKAVRKVKHHEQPLYFYANSSTGKLRESQSKMGLPQTWGHTLDMNETLHSEQRPQNETFVRATKPNLSACVTGLAPQSQIPQKSSRKSVTKTLASTPA